MNLDKQVCSFGLAKKLKELGVKQESYFWWVETKRGEIFIWDSKDKNLVAEVDHRLAREHVLYSAFTVAELLEKMPDYIDTDHGRSYLKIDKRNMYPGVEYSCGYHSDVFERFNKGFAEDDSFSNAIAKMLIYLLENKLIDIPSV